MGGVRQFSVVRPPWPVSSFQSQVPEGESEKRCADSSHSLQGLSPVQGSEGSLPPSLTWQAQEGIVVESVYVSISSSPFVATVFQLMKREDKAEREEFSTLLFKNQK